MLIQILVVLDSRFPVDGFVLVSGGLKYVHGANIAFEHTGENTVNLKILKDITRHDRQGFGHDSPPPIRFAEPVPDFGIVPINIILNRKTNVANGLPVDVNRQVVGLLI